MGTIKRAIIMAAGIGKRMQPVTFDIPKPLIAVNGKKMIDTVVEALHENGISEIYVVVGYLKEQFYKWAENKSGITIIENPVYDSCNNISSLYAAKDFIEEAFILDGDQIIYNPQILNPVYTKSGYSAVWTEEQTEEWVMSVNDDNSVVSCSRTGGCKGWQLFSVSRWSSEDGKKLKKYLIEEFDNKQNRQIYWDDVAMFCHFDDFELTVYPMNKSDIVEIDNFSELTAIDGSYEKYISGEKNGI